MRWVDLWEHPRADWLAVSKVGKRADESADQWDFYWVVKTVDETACCWAGTLDCARVERKAATRVFEWVEQTVDEKADRLVAVTALQTAAMWAVEKDYCWAD